MAGIAICAAQPAETSPPKELLQYVHEAAKGGVKDDKIKQQAVQSGWSAAVVDQAIAYERGGAKSAKPAAPEAVKADSAKAQPPATQPPADEHPTAPAESAAERAEGGTPAPAGAIVNPSVPPDYQIAIGDTIQVSVWKETEVSVPSEMVRPDGKISVPLAKDVDVAGLTPREAEKRIAEQLAKFYTDPNVTVVVTSMAPKKIYVTGGVKKEGPVPFTYGMRVMQAISEAGGLTDYAKRKKIYILHTEMGREYRLDFNYDEVLKGIRMEQNVLLVPGDTIVVPN